MSLSLFHKVFRGGRWRRATQAKCPAAAFAGLAVVMTTALVTAQDATRTWVYEATSSREPGVKLVDDPYALDGKALECPASDKTWSNLYTFQSGYTTDYLPGEYEVRYRLKVEDNTVKDYQFAVGVQGGGVWQHLRGTDFKEAGEYQEFVYPFTIERPVLNICVVRKVAGPRAWIDRVTVTRKRLFSDTEQLAFAEFERPEKPWLLPEDGMQVWFVKGLYYQYYGIHTLLESMRADIEYAYIVRGQRGSALHGVPLEGKPPEDKPPPTTPQESIGNGATPEAATGTEDALAEEMLTEIERQDQGLYPNPEYDVVMRRDLVVLCNADAECLTVKQRAMLQDFVKAGGGLLVIGGPFAFGRGMYHRSDLLEALLPVTTPGYHDLIEFPTAVPMKLARGDLSLTQIEWTAEPMVMWLHEATPKPEATVELTADGRPALVTWSYGKGRVAALTATVLGESAAGQTAFWRWKDWPTLMEVVVRWLLPQNS